MEPAKSHWLIRILARSVWYGFAGALVCGIYGALQGMLIGGLVVDWYELATVHSMPFWFGPAFGGAVGAVGSTGLGIILFGGAAPFSQPNPFRVGFARMAALALLGMTPGPLTLTLVVIGLRQTVGHWTYNLDPLIILIYGTPWLLWLGQACGTLLGNKRRWGPMEERFVEGTWLAVKTGLGFGGATSLFAILAHPHSGGVPLFLNCGLAIGAGFIAVLYAMACCLMATLFLPPALREDNFVQKIRGGSLAGLLPALILASCWFNPTPQAMLRWLELDFLTDPNRTIIWLPFFMPAAALAGGLAALGVSVLGRIRRLGGSRATTGLSQA